MTNATIFVGQIDIDDGTHFKVSGTIFAPDLEASIPFTANGIAYNSNAVAVNAAIKDAAVAAAAEDDLTIGGIGDTLTVFCGAQLL